MTHITAEHLQAIIEKIFVGASVPKASAEQVAGSLVESNLVGHDSHGVLRISAYIKALEDGRVNPHGKLTVLRESATTALIDGGANFGQIVARQAMDRAMDKARAHDIGMVAVRNSGHTGRLGEYSVQAAKAGFIGMVMGSGSRKGGAVAPYGGISPVFNTNPITWGVPAAEHPPLFLDFATSACAWGKIQAAIDKGAQIPLGWLLDADGKPTTDPTEGQRGGVMLPFGAHKGYGLSFLVEVLSGGLTGTSCAALANYQPGYTLVMVAINIAAFQPLPEFCQMVDELIIAAKSARRATGIEEILAPGEYEWQTREARLRDGLDLPEATWQRIVDAGVKYGVAVTA